MKTPLGTLCTLFLGSEQVWFVRLEAGTFIRVNQWCPNSAKEGWGEFPLFTFCIPQSTLPLSKTVHCIAVVVCWCFIWQLPSNSLFVAITDYIILLFRFDFTLLLLKVGGRGIYTDYVIVTKETSLGIDGVNYGKYAGWL